MESKEYYNNHIEEDKYETLDKKVLKKAKITCLYFGAEFNKPSQRFSQKLKEFYYKINDIEPI